MAEYHMHPNFGKFENATVLVADSHKAHLLIIRADHVEEGDHFNAVTNTFTDREGFFVGKGSHGGSPVADHAEAEHDKMFVKQLCDALLKRHQQSPFHKLIICAPAKMLGQLEDHLHNYLKDILEETVKGEFTNLSAHEVVTHL